MVRLRDSWPFSLSAAPTVGNPARPLQPESVSQGRGCPRGDPGGGGQCALPPVLVWSLRCQALHDVALLLFREMSCIPVQRPAPITPTRQVVLALTGSRSS